MILGALLVVISCSGCSRRILEVKARLGVEIDSGSGFYAYYTAAPASDEQSITLFVANEDSLVEPKAIRGATAARVYPIALKDNDGIAVRPDTLAKLIGADGIGFEDEDPYVELGYFRNLVWELDARPGAYMDNEEDIVPGGLAWGDPNDALANQILQKVGDCIRVAAEYGANAIIELAVLYDGSSFSSYGPPGFYLYGRAIAYTVE